MSPLHSSGRRLLVLLSAVVVLSGCTRAFYRRQADTDAARLVTGSAAGGCVELTDYTIQPSPQSRMFDPYNPDREPLPPDDPAAHRLMHCVDGKKGWKHWHRNGDTPTTENPLWRSYLPCDENGNVTVDREGAVCLAYLNSREYQNELEDVYLSALEVSFQRFRLQTQFFFTNDTTFTADGRLRPGGGGQPSSILENDATLQVKRYFATGGQLLAEVANSMVWQFAGPDQYATTTLLDFSLFQPLLRAAGRAVALELLTQAERSLLANIRQLLRYRDTLTVLVLNGRPVTAGPGPDGVALAALATTGVPQGAAAAATGVATGGVLGLLAEDQVIANQRENVAGLAASVEQLEDTYNANRIDRFQVDLARQSLYNAQSRLLQIEKAHQDRLDAFKITLGLPPDVKLQIKDPLLKGFQLIDSLTNDVQDATEATLRKVREAPEAPSVEIIQSWLPSLEQLEKAMERLPEMFQADMDAVEKVIPQRRQSLRRLAQRHEVQRGDVDRQMVDVEVFDKRIVALREDRTQLAQQYQATITELREAIARIAELSPSASPELRETGRRRLQDRLLELLSQISQLSLVQARARLQAITLAPVEMSPETAYSIALMRRRDLMNARTALVDVWRQIEVRANALLAGLDVTFSGDVRTTGNNPLAFTSTTGRLRVGLQFDAPLTRLVERNVYRESLIEYQRARRAYYAFQDRINQGLRQTLRQIQLDQLNFEIRRTAVYLAIVQVDVTRLRLIRPPKPGETQQLGATTSRDLVQSLAELVSSQNDILGVYTDYEAQRLNLDLDLGTMELDRCGYWVDPGPMVEDASNPPALEEIPSPEPLLRALSE